MGPLLGGNREPVYTENSVVGGFEQLPWVELPADRRWSRILSPTSCRSSLHGTRRQITGSAETISRPCRHLRRRRAHGSGSKEPANPSDEDQTGSPSDSGYL